MPKLTFSTIPRAHAEPKRVEIATKAGIAEFWLVPLDGPRREAANEQSDELTRRFIDGGFVHPTTEEWTKEPEAFPQIDGEDVTVSPRLFQMLCRFEHMQKPPNVTDTYTWEDLMHLAVKDDDAWVDLQVACAEVTGAGKA